MDSGFLSVMDIPLLAGRNFTDADDTNAQPVTIVSESFARKYWPGDDAIGEIHHNSARHLIPRRVVGMLRQS